MIGLSSHHAAQRPCAMSSPVIEVAVAVVQDDRGHVLLAERTARQVAAGIYREVIRFRDHMAPLAEGLGRRAARGDLIACASS